MTDPSVFLICHDRVHAQDLASKLSGNGIAIVGLAHNLMDAYTAAEEISPELVLVEDRFAQLPEFEMLLALFKAMDTRWLALGHGDGSSGGPAVVSTAKSGLFPVNSDSDPGMIARKIREITRAPQKAIGRQNPGTGNSAQYTKNVVLIGSSTGGIDALSTLLGQYPSNCPPTVIVQHTGKTFGSGLVRLFERLCPANVVAVEDGLELRPGMVCVAAGIDQHVQVSGGSRPVLRFQAGGPVSGHLPSIDKLFQSALPPSDVIGVLLTGMGRDGAEGLLHLRKSGAQTIGQDEASSVVYGMPKVAADLGAVQHQLPLDQIAGRILECCVATGTKQVRAGA